jgi:hypothetical protein
VAWRTFMVVPTWLKFSAHRARPTCRLAAAASWSFRPAWRTGLRCRDAIATGKTLILVCDPGLGLSITGAAPAWTSSSHRCGPPADECCAG